MFCFGTCQSKVWVALGESFHLCRLKNHENSKPQPGRKTSRRVALIYWGFDRCSLKSANAIHRALTDWELKKARYQKTFSLLRPTNCRRIVFLHPSFRRMAQIKKEDNSACLQRMHLARRITSQWSACLCRRELVRAVEDSSKKLGEGL